MNRLAARPAPSVRSAPATGPGLPMRRPLPGLAVLLLAAAGAAFAPAALAAPEEEPAAAADAAPGVSASRVLDLARVIDATAAHNLGVRAGAAQLASGAAAVRRARAPLLPSLDARIETREIDHERASTGFGRAPEYRTGGVLELDQVLYSDAARARHQIAERMQSARTAQQQGVVLDAVLDAGVAYLDLLRAESAAHIAEEQLRLTRSNLDRAKSRLELGVANRSEVLRWQTELARARRGVADARAGVDAARVEVNRLMNAPEGDLWQTAAPALDDPDRPIADPVLVAALADPDQRPELARFLVAEGLADAPSIERAGHEVEARDRALLAARRSLIRPKVVASAMLDQRFMQAGAGQDQPSFGPGFTGGTLDATAWSVALRAELPILQGGARSADIDGARADREAARLRLDDARARTRAGILAALRMAEASYDGIAWAHDAADAGRQNLQLVNDAYGRGVLTVIDVLDAQTASLAADLQAANAQFDFMIDWLRLQRLTGHFDLIASDAEREALHAQFAAATGAP